MGMVWRASSEMVDVASASRRALNPGSVHARATIWAPERGARPVAPLASGDVVVNGVRVDVAVVVQVPLEHLGPLLRAQLVHDASSRSRSQTSTTTVWSAAAPKRSPAAKDTE